VSDKPDAPVDVHSVQEEYFYLMLHPCSCGGAWAGGDQQIDPASAGVSHHVAARCHRCGAERTFHFRLAAPAGPHGPVRQVNPTSEPSRALDAAQWLDLARFYLGRIERLTSAEERAQSLLDARQCLEEALKFYGPGDDGPPPSALWSEKSRAQVAASPGACRRAALEAMLAKIPPMDRLRQADARVQREFEKAVKDRARKRVGKWWQFWKRL